MHTHDQTLNSAETRRVWIQKGKRRQQATARALKAIAGVLFILVALGSAIYFLAVR